MKINDKFKRKVNKLALFFIQITELGNFLKYYDAHNSPLKKIYNDYLSDLSNSKIGFNTFVKISKCLGFKYKAIKQTSPPNVSVKYQKQHFYSYLSKQLQNGHNFIGFFDVSSISDRSFKQKGWSLPYKNCYVKSKFIYNLTHLLALTSNKGIYFVKFLRGNIINFDLIDFLSHCINKLNKRYDFENIYIVLDNCSLHRTKYFLNFAKHRKVNLIFTIPHNPQLNCVEYFFRYVKSGLKSHFVLKL